MPLVLDDEGPIDRVQKILDRATIENVLIMQGSIAAAYDQGRANALQDFVKSQHWGNGQEVTALIVMLCANFASMPLDLKPKMLDNMLVAMLSVMHPMTLEIRELNKKAEKH
jgi:hypothetical protein